MSTRCQMGFYGEKDEFNSPTAIVYKHNYGEEEKLIPLILPILQDFDKNRGLRDVEYAAAWLVAKLKNDYSDIGISKTLHGDIERYYAIYPDRVDVYDVLINESSGRTTFGDLKFKNTVKI